jgi:hypothetical protein
MTAEKSASKRTFNITIMRPVFQVAVFQVEAATQEEAIELAQEREMTLTEQDWNGPWERAIYEETGNDSLQVFRGVPKPADPGERG